MAKRDNRLAARALADWARHRFARSQETAIADKYGVATRTLWRWKDALDDDPELSALYKQAVERHLDGDWANQLDGALGDAIAKLRELIQASESLEDVTEAFAKLSEVAIAKEMLHGALTGQQADGAAAGDGTHRRHAPALGPN
jgi:hypothetical protein